MNFSKKCAPRSGRSKASVPGTPPMSPGGTGSNTPPALWPGSSVPDTELSSLEAGEINEPSSAKVSVLDTVISGLSTTVTCNRTPEVDYEESTPPDVDELEEKRPASLDVKTFLGSDTDSRGSSPDPRNPPIPDPVLPPRRLKERKPFPEDTSLLKLRGNDTVKSVISSYHKWNEIRKKQYASMTPAGRSSSWRGWCQLYNDNGTEAAFKAAMEKRDRRQVFRDLAAKAKDSAVKASDVSRPRSLRERVESSGYLPAGVKASSRFDSSVPDREYEHQSKKLRVSSPTGRVPARRPAQGLEHPSSRRFEAPRSTGSRGNQATSLRSVSPLSCSDGGGYSPPATYSTLAHHARVAAPSMGAGEELARLRAEFLQYRQETVLHRQDAQSECRSVKDECRSLRERNDAVESHCRKLLRRVESLESKVSELSRKKRKPFLASPSPDDSA